MLGTVTVQAHGELNDFLPAKSNNRYSIYELKKTRSVKDMIESIGIPHAEIDQVIIDGDWEDVGPGDFIEVQITGYDEHDLFAEPL